MHSPQDSIGDALRLSRPSVCLSVCPSDQMLVPRYLVNGLNTWVRWPDLVKFWRPKVKGQGHSRPKCVVLSPHVDVRASKSGCGYTLCLFRLSSPVISSWSTNVWP